MRKILFGLLGLLFTIPSWALPAGYTELEYIESTGTQYIDTGVQITQDLRMDITFQLLEVPSANTYIFGNFSNDDGQFYLYSLTGKWQFAYGNGYTTLSEGSVTTDKHTMSFYIQSEKTYINIDGDIYNFPVLNTMPTENIFVAGAKHVPQTSSKTYGVTFFKSGTLYRNLVPAQRNSDNVIGMYDTVNNRFYTNAGTGSFIAGSEVDNSCRNLLDTPERLETAKWYKSTGTIVSTDPDTRRFANFTIQIIKSDSDTPVHSGCSRNFYGPENNVKCTFTTPENTTSCRFYNNGERINSGTSVFPCEPNTQYTFSMDVISANPTIANGIIYSHMQLEKGNTATEFTPACTGINVATTEYTSRQFEPLSNAISVVDSVVSNTIAQAASIATLQSGKQTRPNDIADNNEKCPAYKQCLLVEDENGTPHWYQITDPFRDFVAPIITNNVAPDTIYNNTEIWRVTWNANATTGVTAGTVRGEYLCNNVSGTFTVPATNEQISSENWNVGGGDCWCRATEFDDGNGVNRIDGTWVSRIRYNSVSECKQYCVSGCRLNMQDNSGFRNAIIQ